MNKLIKYLLMLLGGLTAVIAAFVFYLIFLQPPFYFPRPTGKYAVGSKDYHWTDRSRKEAFANDPKHPNRELMVKIWYPAAGQMPENPSTPYVPYNVDYFKKMQASDFVGKLAFRSAYSYAQPERPLAPDRLNYPIIIFSHGFGCTGSSNTAHCEELASHGYIVVGINHTYDSCTVQFPDGRTANIAKSYGKRINDQEIEIWISDVQFVLDKLEQLDSNQSSQFYQRLDKINIGMFGHSFGGATTVQMCLRDARVKAGVLMDSSLFGINATKGFNKPFMSMIGEDSIKIFERSWTRDDWDIFGVNSPEEEVLAKSRYLPAIQQLSQAIGHDVYTFVVKDAWHMDFYDSAFGIKFASSFGQILVALGAGSAFGVGLGSIDGFKAIKIVNAYLLNFFDKYLKGKPSDLLDGKEQRYSEVQPLPQENTSLLIVDFNSGQIIRSIGDCQTQESPYSTFKIALSLMGFDSGILKDENNPEWLYKDEYNASFDFWRQPHTPKMWIKNSCVWYSQKLTSILGTDKFARYVQSFEYGNQDVSGNPGKNDGLSGAWLNSSLKISPQQQVAFIKKLLTNSLPVSKHAHEQTKKILFNSDLGGGWTLYAKTGGGGMWFVGWAVNEIQNKTYIFACLEKAKTAKQTVLNELNKVRGSDETI